MSINNPNAGYDSRMRMEREATMRQLGLRRFHLKEELAAIDRVLNGFLSQHRQAVSPDLGVDIKRTSDDSKVESGPSIRQLAEAILSAHPSGLTTKELVEEMGKRGRQNHKSSMSTIAQTLRRHYGIFKKKKGKWKLGKPAKTKTRKTKVAKRKEAV